MHSFSRAMLDVVVVVFEIAAGLVLGVVALSAYWRVRSIVSVWRAPERRLHSRRAVIWRDPGDVARLDLAAGPGGPDGAPHPPYMFLEEHFSGSRPSISVRDARNRKWRVKWGDEVRAEALATRLAWAAGYFVETTYYVADGQIEGVPSLQRAAGSIGADGEFRDARFELDEAGVITHFDAHSWAWNDNPFIGTRELSGLKIVMMWVSNWDAKDVRDVARGSNTAIFECLGAGGVREARYLVTDWGGAFGRWGSVVTRGRWDCRAFEAETPKFVTGVDDEIVRFGYSGQHTADIAEGIRVKDVRWLDSHLNRLSERQIAEAVRASGGSVEDVEVFARALRARLDALAAVSAAGD